MSTMRTSPARAPPTAMGISMLFSSSWHSSTAGRTDRQRARPNGSRGEASPALLGGWWEHPWPGWPCGVKGAGRGCRGPAPDHPAYSPGPNLPPSTRNACTHTLNTLSEKVLVTCRRCSALHLYEFPAVACSALSELLVAVKLRSAKAVG